MEVALELDLYKFGEAERSRGGGAVTQTGTRGTQEEEE